jgi:hypothetical protein
VVGVSVASEFEGAVQVLDDVAPTPPINDASPAPPARASAGWPGARRRAPRG